MLKLFWINFTRNHRRWYFRHNNFQPEVDNDVISSLTVDNVSMDVRVKFGGSGDIRGADLVLNEHIEAYHISLTVVSYKK